MSKLTSILLAPYNFFFGENGIFESSASRNQKRDNSQTLYFGLPAVVFAILGLLFLVFGELSAGKTLIRKYKDSIEEIRKEKSKLASSLSQELKMAKSKQNDVEKSDLDTSTLRADLSANLDSEQIYLRKLYSIAPDEPEHLYDLAITFLTKSQLVKLNPASSKEERIKWLTVSKDLKDQGIAIMKGIAPIDKPGFLKAHVFLAENALGTKAKSASERAENLRLASAHLDNALVRDQSNATALGMKVLISQRMGKTEDAKKYLSELFKTDPFVYPHLCQANVQLGKAGENPAILNRAQQKLSEEIARMTGSSDRRTKYLKYLVDCLHRLDKLDEADKRVRNEMAEFLNDDGIQRWGNRLLAISQKLRYDEKQPMTAQNASELVGYLREGYRLDPNNVSILERIVALQQSNIAGLDKISKEIYQPGPKAPPSVENILGKIALTEGDYLEATKHFSRANAKSPNNAQFLNNLSYVYLTRPDPDPKEALKLVDKAIRNVRSGTIAASYLTNFFDTKGRALLALGKIAEENGDQELANSQYAASAAKLLAALVDRPNNLQITQAIVECYEASGQTQQVVVWRDRVKQLQASQN